MSNGSKSKFGGALAIGKKAIGQETASEVALGDAPQATPNPTPEQPSRSSDASSLSPAASVPPEPKPKPEPEPSLYTDNELKQVNAGGLKVAFAVRRHWMLQAHLKGVSLASIIKPALIEELGLPAGFTADNLSAPGGK